MDSMGQAGIYTGQLLVETGMAHGHGTMEYNATTVKANVNANANANANNTNANAIAANNIEMYKGDWNEGYWHGQGTCRLVNGDIYQGQFDRQKRHGVGEYTWNKVVKPTKVAGQVKVEQRVYKGQFKHNGDDDATEQSLPTMLACKLSPIPFTSSTQPRPLLK